MGVCAARYGEIWGEICGEIPLLGVRSDETTDGSVAYSSGVTLPGRRER